MLVCSKRCALGESYESRQDDFGVGHESGEDFDTYAFVQLTERRCGGCFEVGFGRLQEGWILGEVW